MAKIDMEGKIWVIIPVKSLANIKSRLSPILDVTSRRRFNLCMLHDVVKPATRSGLIDEVLVVSPDRQVTEYSKKLGVEILCERSELGVNQAVATASNLCVENDASATLILPSDIPLISPEDLNSIIYLGLRKPSIVLSPSLRFDGTNVLLLNPPRVIPTHYEQDSYRSHMREAIERGVKVGTYLSRSVMLDIDSSEDLKNFLNSETDASSHQFLIDYLNPSLRISK